MLLNNRIFKKFKISAFTPLIQFFTVWILYCFQSSFKISYCIFCFLSFSPYLIQLLLPFCLAPFSFLFISQSIVLSSHLSSLVSWFSFLLLFMPRQSRDFLKSPSLFYSIYFIFKVSFSIWFLRYCAPLTLLCIILLYSIFYDFFEFFSNKP